MNPNFQSLGRQFLDPDVETMEHPVKYTNHIKYMKCSIQIQKRSVRTKGGRARNRCQADRPASVQRIGGKPLAGRQFSLGPACFFIPVH